MGFGQVHLHTAEAAGVRATLGVLLGFGAVNAFGGAYYGLAGAEGVPREWLEGSAFSDYTIPSVILGAVVGGSFLLAAIAVFTRWRNARLLAIAAGVIVLGWIAVQVAIIGYVSWMQPVTAAWGVAVLLVARALGVQDRGGP
jgi:peptidoglycan/LPS O-acetylase OafA/YrhL